MGIRIDLTMVRIKFYNTFMTLFFDIINFVSAVIIAILYYSQGKDISK